MLKTHFTIALRRFMRRPGHAILHVLGLGAGLAACVVVLLFAAHELTYDRFHANAHRIFRVDQEIVFGEHVFTAMGVSRRQGSQLEDQVASVERVVLVGKQSGVLRLPETGVAYEEEDVLYATPGFFDVFTFPLVRGDPATVLSTPDGAVLTPALARKLFGSTDPIGQTFTFEQGGLGADSLRRSYRVTGLVASPPGNSTLRFSVVLSVPQLTDETMGGVHFTASYAMLTSAADTSVVTRAVTDLLAAERGESTDDGAPARLSPERVTLGPLTTLHARSREASTQTLYLFGTMALFVLLIACINYTNLATAYATQRGREVGVRKTLGATRAALRGQFLSESMLLALCAATGALGLTVMARPAFQRFLGIDLAVTPLSEPWVVAVLFGMALATGLLAGAYPSFVLSRKRPVQALKGLQVGRERGFMRRALVVVQFALAVGMIAATAVVDRQLEYGQHRVLRLAGDQVLTLDLSAPTLQKLNLAMRDAIGSVPGVRHVVRASSTPGSGNRFVGITGTVEGAEAGDRSGIITSILTAEPGYDQVFDLRLVAGRALRESEDRTGVVLNETAAREYGLMAESPQEALGRKIKLMGTREVVGVVEDFVFTSVHNPISPLALFVPSPKATVSSGFVAVGGLSVLAVELEAGRTREALAGMARAWQRVAPDYPFEYQFVDEAFAETLKAEERVRTIFGAAALLAALLACLGLFGLAAFAAEQRTKEIGVRKVLGASVGRIVMLLTRDFALLVVIAFMIAAPVTYTFMQRWLERFAYRVDVETTTFLWTGAAVLLLALATVTYHAVRAATTNPVHSLRSE